MLVDAHSLPKWVQNPLTARIKIMAQADITERRTPQDGSFTIRHADRLIDVRVSVLPTMEGESSCCGSSTARCAAAARSARFLGRRPAAHSHPAAAARRHDPRHGPDRQRQVEHALRDDPGDLFAERNIVTIEDPVEFKIPASRKSTVKEKQGLTSRPAALASLRQDPDVIMVGEIRDRETAEIAFRAALDRPPGAVDAAHRTTPRRRSRG